jgi:hypothetical protein
MSVQYEFTPLRWGHTQTCVEGGGGVRHVEGGGGAGTHISTESSESEEEPTPTSPSSHPSRRSGAATAGASHLLHMRGRSGVATAGAFYLVARGRSKPSIAVSDLPLYELQVLANHR